MTQPADLPAESSLDIAKLFEEHRRDLQRYAQQHLRDADLAEDAVQETFVAALRHPNFAGRSEVRTWLVAILKHKIVDIVRRRARIESVETSVPGAEEHEDLSELLFNPAGRWIEPPALQELPQDLADAEAAPEAVEGPGSAQGSRLEEAQLGRLGGQRLLGREGSGEGADQAANGVAVELVFSAEVEEHPHVGAAGLLVPDVVGELQVADHAAVRGASGGGPQVHTGIVPDRTYEVKNRSA